MNTNEIVAAIDAFLALHIHGSRHSKAQAAFPDLPELEGVHLRRPAAVGEPPEYEPAPVSPVDGQLFDAGARGL